MELPVPFRFFKGGGRNREKSTPTQVAVLDAASAWLDLFTSGNAEPRSRDAGKEEHRAPPGVLEAVSGSACIAGAVLITTSAHEVAGNPRASGGVATHPAARSSAVSPRPLTSSTHSLAHSFII